jgi:hypothetical protein
MQTTPGTMFNSCGIRVRALRADAFEEVLIDIKDKY